MLIVKIGGGEDLNLTAIVQGLARLKEPMIIVHGGNAARDDLAARLNQPVQVITSDSGYSSVLSDRNAVELQMMAYAGLCNKRLVELCQQQGVNAVGLSGVDGGVIRARRNRGIRVTEAGRRRLVHDHSGKPIQVNRRLLEMLILSGHVPVLTVPILDENQVAVNSENDEIVRLLQQEFQATRVLQFMGAPGILRDANDPGSVISHLDAESCAQWEQQHTGRIRRKLRALNKLLADPSVRVLIGDGRIEDPVGHLLAGGGTLAQTMVA